LNDAGPAPLARTARSVPGNRALVWFGEAIRLWKQRAVVFSAMALVVLATSIAFETVPGLGLVMSNVIAPLLACGFLYGALAADSGDRPRITHLFAVFAAPARAQFAVVAAGIAVTLVESAAAWAIADINLFSPTRDATGLSAAAILAIYAVGIAASMPLQFVPMAALFDGEGPVSAFASSLRACARNPLAMLLLATYCFALLMAALATMGIGLVLALPWIAIVSYSAWKDIFGVSTGGPARGRIDTR